VDIPNGKKYVVWVRIAKTGSTSTEDTLIHMQSFVKYQTVLKDPNKLDPNRHIIRVTDLSQLTEGDIDMDECFIFAVVRNPYQRALSGWNYHKWFRAKDNFTHALKNPPQKDKDKEEGAWRHFTKTMTQHLLYDNRLRIDHVIKLENYDEEFSKFLCEKLGFSKSDFNILKKNANGKKKQNISREELDLINKRFADDFKNFGYEMK